MLWLTTHQLKNGSAIKRKKAAKELWREPNPRNIGILTTAALSDPDAEGRQIAASALGRMQSPARVEPLLKILLDKDPDVIRSATLALRRVNDDRVLDAMIPLLRHHDFIVRTSAAQTIDTLRWAPQEKDLRIWF